MNKYIQDKLDEFHKIFTEYKNIKDGSMDSFFEKYVMVVLKESYNEGKTDYHNHIVEIAVNDFGKLMNKLQDTNPKE